MKVVVAQLVECSLPNPEVRGSIPVMGKHLFAVNCIEKRKNKEKKPGMANFQEGVTVLPKLHYN